MKPKSETTPTSALAVPEQKALSLAQPLEFSEEQRQMIRNTYANGASDSEFAVLMEIAKARRLNPLLQQIYFVKRWDREKRMEVWRPQVSIDGFRVIADRTGVYDGQDEPEFTYDKQGSLLKCRVLVYRKGISRPFAGVAFWKEYAQTTKDGGLTMMWSGKPHVMLGKCAEALALRKAFPEDTSGLYIPEEMGEMEVNPAPPSHADDRFAEPEPKELPAASQVVDHPPPPKTAPRDTSPKIAKAPPAVATRQRAVAIWTRAQALGMSAESFKGFIRGVLGPTPPPSNTWTDADCEKLEMGLEFVQPAP